MKYAIIDFETTGGQLSKPNRAMEIGIVISDGQNILDTFSSLINPGVLIDPFVQNLTGIKDEMLKGQPKFSELAETILNMTKGAVFVAHNVGFDYSILTKEFENLSIFFKRARVCTVKLSRSAFPGLDGGHSLSNLTKKFNITLESHHRALDDALATQKLLSILINEKGEEWITERVSGYVNTKNLPKSISFSDISDIPESSGVFRFYDKKHKLLYISYSNNILSSIATFFNNSSKRNAAAGIRSSIYSLDWDAYPSELLARLLYADELLNKEPPGNRNYRVPLFSGGGLNDCVLFHGKQKSKIAFVWKNNSLQGWQIVNNSNISIEDMKSLNYFQHPSEITPIFRRWLVRKNFGVLDFL